MSDYKPVPVKVANEIADRFEKDAVVIASIDLVHELTHYTTFGRTPHAKVLAAKVADEMCEVMHDGVKMKMFEDFRHLDLATLKSEKEKLIAELAEVTVERDKLKRFKEYVHARLDAAGVPTDPDSPHKEKGCRIGGRLDIVLAYLSTAADLCAALKEARRWWTIGGPPGVVEQMDAALALAKVAFPAEHEVKPDAT